MAPRKPKSAPAAGVFAAPAMMQPAAPVAQIRPIVAPEASAPVPPAIPDVEEAVEAVLAQNVEVQDNVHRFTEETVEQTRAAYLRLKAIAEDATGSLEATYAAATSGMKDLHSVAMEAMKANTDAAFEFFKAMLGAKDLSDAMKLQSDHIRKQMDALNVQARDMGAAAQRLAQSAEPLKATLGKGFGLAA
jgi:phasin